MRNDWFVDRRRAPTRRYGPLKFGGLLDDVVTPVSVVGALSIGCCECAPFTSKATLAPTGAARDGNHQPYCRCPLNGPRDVRVGSAARIGDSRSSTCSTHPPSPATCGVTGPRQRGGGLERA